MIYFNIVGVKRTDDTSYNTAVIYVGTTYWGKHQPLMETRLQGIGQVQYFANPLLKYAIKIKAPWCEHHADEWLSK